MLIVINVRHGAAAVNIRSLFHSLDRSSVLLFVCVVVYHFTTFSIQVKNQLKSNKRRKLKLALARFFSFEARFFFGA